MMLGVVDPPHQGPQNSIALGPSTQARIDTWRALIAWAHAGKAHAHRE
jgi:hypothetical protein